MECERAIILLSGMIDSALGPIARFRVHRHITGFEGIHHRDLHPVRIFFRNVVGVHPAERPCAPDNGAILRIERTQALVHSAVACAERVEHIADRGDVQLFLDNPGETFGVTGEGWFLGHG